MSADGNLGRQFTVLHAYTEDPWLEDDDEGTQHFGHGVVSVRDSSGEEVHRTEYQVRNPWDEYQRPKIGEREISGIYRHTWSEENHGKGYASAAQDAILRAHPGLPMVSYTADMRDDAHRFYQSYMKRHPTTPWQIQDADRY